jgi:signal transduction histidine kinase
MVSRMSNKETPNREALPKSYQVQVQNLINEAQSNILAKKFSEAKLVIAQVYKLSEHYNYRLGKAEAIFQEGNLHEAEYQFQKAMDVYARGLHWLDSFLQTNQEKLIFLKIQLRLGVVNFFEQRYETSLEFLFPIIEDLSNEPTISNEERSVLCNAHFSTALVYSQNKYKDIAIYHLDKTIELAKAVDDDDILGRSYNALAMTKLENQETTLAKQYFDKSIEHKQRIGDERGITAVYLNISRLYVSLKEYGTAYEYIEKALGFALSDTAYEKLLLGSVYQQKGKVEFLLNQSSKAIATLGESVNCFAQIKNYPFLANTYQLFCDIYEAQGNYSLAYQYAMKLNEVNQKIIEQEKKKNITELQIKYSTQEKNREAELYKIKSEALERSNQSLEEFAYIVAHDLKSPLRSITGYVSLLKRQSRNVLDDNALEFIRLTVDSVKQMERLINDLLDFAKVESKPLEHLEEVDLNNVIAIAIQNLQHYMTENTEIICEHLPTIPADELQLLQLFQNLIENGLKYNKSEKPFVKIEAVKRNSQIEISVEDNGIGIPTENRTQVFEIFQRLHHKNEFSGTGIGLSICKKIVEIHSGKIWIETPKSGQGSVFKLTLNS